MSSPAIGLRLYCPLDDASGTSARDVCGRGPTGTLTGTQAWASGKVGGAFDFDETQFFSFGTGQVLNLTTRGTIAAWINPDDLGGSSAGRIFERDNASTAGYAFHCVSSTGNKLALTNRAQSQTVASTGTLTFGSWQHVAVTWNATAVTFYKNGVAAGTATMSGSIVGGDGIQATAGNDPTAANGFDGEIDELGVWNRDLTLNEIAWIYNGGSGRVYTRWWLD